MKVLNLREGTDLFALGSLPTLRISNWPRAHWLLKPIRKLGTDPYEHPLIERALKSSCLFEVLRQIRHRQADAVVIMITANVLVDETIAALRGGAYDFIGKPINLEELQVAIRNGIEAGRLRKEVSLFRRERAQQFSFKQIVGESPAMREMLALFAQSC